MPQSAPPHRHARRSRGFTLIELMITVAIVGILAMVALPRYTDHVKGGKLNEAFTQLTSQALVMEQWYQDNRTYASAPICQNVANAPVGKYFTTTCASGTSTDFTLKATANTGSGVEGAIYTINRAGEQVTLGMPSGWTVPTKKCWGTDRSGGC